MCLAFLVHHFDKLNEKLSAGHPLRVTPLFELPAIVAQKSELGPELGDRGSACECVAMFMSCQGQVLGGSTGRRPRGGRAFAIQVGIRWAGGILRRILCDVQFTF